MEIQVYLFDTIESANKAVQLINEGENIPREGCVTNVYCEPMPHDDKYYILKDEVTEKYLTDFVTIELISNRNV
jgi:hypothetical protein